MRPLPHSRATPAISLAWSSVSFEPKIFGRIKRPSPLCIGCSAPGHQPLICGAQASRAPSSIVYVIESLVGKIDAVTSAAPEPASEGLVEDARDRLKRTRILALDEG